jgi:Trk K+ transport system NAD-binding subunit
MSRKSLFGQDKEQLHVLGIVPPQTVLQKGDVLLLFGATRDLEEFMDV